MTPEKLRTEILEGIKSRKQILGFKRNLNNALSDPSKTDEFKLSAQQYLDVIAETEIPPSMAEYIFMGYCPGGQIERALDEMWIKDSYCDFTYVESQVQMDKFFNIVPGDILILKKMLIDTQEMDISAWGRVKSIHTSKQTGIPYLRVEWTPKEILRVPLMGCVATVNVRSLEKVEAEMPVEFWDWLKS